MIGRKRWIGPMALMAVIPGVLAERSFAQPAVTPGAPLSFSWSVPAGFEPDPLGRIVETRPGQVRRGPWPVRLEVAPTSCDERGRYRWYVKRHRLHAQRGPGCSFLTKFAKEGSYDVRLDATVRGRTSSATQTLTVQDRLIVSLGDSVASGEGVPDVAGFRHATWQFPRCHRSARAGPAQAAAQIERDDDRTSVTFVHLACSGATIEKGVLGPYDGALKGSFTAPLEPQLDTLARIDRRRPVDAVLISVGANDVYFGDIVRFCAFHKTPNCFDKPLPGGSGRTVSDAVVEAFRALGRNYDRVARALTSIVRPTQVYIVDYFDPTRDAEGHTCRVFLGFIGANELELAQSRVLVPLNQAVADAAGRNGWRVVTGMADLFREHGLCARQSWITSVGQSLMRLGGPLKGHFLGTLHPNVTGQTAIGDAIAGSFEREFFPGQRFERRPLESSASSDNVSTAAIVGIVAGAIALGAVSLLVGWRLGHRRAMRKMRAAP